MTTLPQPMSGITTLGATAMVSAVILAACSLTLARRLQKVLARAEKAEKTVACSKAHGAAKAAAERTALEEIKLQAKSAFVAWDRESKGYLTERDVAAALRGRIGATTQAWAQAKHQWPPQRIAYMFKRCDTDGDGKIDQNGVEALFLDLWRAQQQGFHEELNLAWSLAESMRQKTNSRDRESIVPFAPNRWEHDRMKEN